MSRTAAGAVGFSLVSLLSGLGWGAVAAASVTMGTELQELHAVLRVGLPVAGCTGLGLLLLRATREYPKNERVALMAGYAIAVATIAWFVVRMVWR